MYKSPLSLFVEDDELLSRAPDDPYDIEYVGELLAINAPKVERGEGMGLVIRRDFLVEIRVNRCRVCFEKKVRTRARSIP